MASLDVQPPKKQDQLTETTVLSESKRGELVVGKKIRATVEKRTFRALIMTVDKEQRTLDVLTLDKQEIEYTVDFDAVEELQTFESSTPPSENEDELTHIYRLKAEAKVLFIKNDFEAAVEWYRKIMTMLSHMFPWKSLDSSLSIVIVKLLNRLHVAEVQGIKSGGDKVLVSLIEQENNTQLNHDDEDDDDDIQLIDKKDIMVSIPPKEHRQFMTSILLNMSRCYLALDSPEQSIWKSTCALRIAVYDQTTNPSWSDTSTLTTAFFLRAKAHAKNSVPRSLMKALRDCRRANEINPNQKEVLRLIKVLEKKESALLKADRKLARDIGAWTEVALEKQQQASSIH